MTEIKLNEWRWGVVPKLDPEAELKIGGHDLPGPRSKAARMSYREFSETLRGDIARWYTVLSLGPPTMPDPELRLPEGWVIDVDEQVHSKSWNMCIDRYKGGDLLDSWSMYRPTRRECVEEINRILGGGK